MLIKLFCVIFATIAVTDCAKLRKTPKVYNALITTDENLTPSKAYPLIQPVIQPAIPVLSPLYPVNFVEQQYLETNANNDNDRQLKNEHAERKSDDETSNAEKPKDEKSPIPLNEYGFPPSLIPLQNYPYNLPFIYDSYGNYQTVQYPVLPPLNYYNSQGEHQLPPFEQPMFEVRPGRRNFKQGEEEKSVQSSAAPSDAIKNNANKNSDIPDVEIPPLPVQIRKD